MKNIYSKLVLIVFLLSTFFQSFSQPVGYYQEAEGKTGDELKTALNQIISKHVDFSYFFSKEIINYSDADPENENNVILFYTQESRNASLYGSGGNYINREHVWAKSHGNFSDIRPMDSDVHNLRPADASVNEDRGNKDFDNVKPNGTQHNEATECWFTGSAWEPGPATKGQVARILFYMATRYEGTNGEMDLEVVPYINTYPKPEHGNLTTLLEWNNQYPPSEMERRRNERIFQIQQNRNPFIDNPEYANYIWNNKAVSELKIETFRMTPETPASGETISILIELENNSLTPDSVKLFWGSNYDALENKKLMNNNQSIYSANDIILTGQPGELVYFKLEIIAGEIKKEIKASYLIPVSTESLAITPINNVQGSGTQTPFLGQQRTISGRVTANFDDSFYLQNGQNKRNGICIYGSLQTGKVGDSLIVTGSAAEYMGLTELSNINYTYNYKSNKVINPIEISIKDINEDYEGMLVKIINVEFEKQGSTFPDENKSYTFSNNDGSSILFSKSSSRLVGQKVPSGIVDVVGIVSEYQGNYQLLARSINDITKSTATSVSSLYKTDIKIYPNPANKKIKIESDETIKEVRVFDLYGKEILVNYNASGEIGLNEFSPGIYILQVVTSNNDLIRQKFIKTNSKL